MENDHILVVDELDSQPHPNLLGRISLLFPSIEKNLRYFKNYYGINGSLEKFKKLISDFEFTNVKNAAKLICWDSVPVVEI
jgi:UDP-N-acetyl-D-mannosaminuronic acid transferase (WecB/TagA/CpsF family)